MCIQSKSNGVLLLQLNGITSTTAHNTTKHIHTSQKYTENMVQGD